MDPSTLAAPCTNSMLEPFRRAIEAAVPGPEPDSDFRYTALRDQGPMLQKPFLSFLFASLFTIYLNQNFMQSAL